jgi:hypothetical protein
MLTIRFMKAPPTTYLLQFKNGQVRREGLGRTCCRACLHPLPRTQPFQRSKKGSSHA